MAAPAERARLRAAGATDVGRQRTNNEDRYVVDVPRGIFAVVDGIGGHAAGDKAADTAIAVLTERLTRQTGAVADRLREAVTIANNEIHRLAATRPDWHGMACVLTAAVVEGDRAVVAHVGDSRLYRLNDGRLEKITPDHSPIGEREDAHELTEFEAMHHPRRNEVYRDVGSQTHEIGDANFVFLTEIDVPEGAALLLCSDGLTDLVPADTIRKIASAHPGAPDTVVRELIGAANAAGGKDNVTAIYIERDTASAPPAGRSRAFWPMVIAVTAVVGAGAGISWFTGSWPPWRKTIEAAISSPATVAVREGESISDAIASATPGSTIVVEPGQYRERLTLGDNIRVVSRVPRGATLRLPSGASEGDALVVAIGVANVELSGFTLVGDAATPLGIGVVARDATVRLTDLDVSGATTTALDLGQGDGTVLLGSDIHDNPGAAIVLRAGSTTRLANNVFSKNATTDRPIAPFTVEPGATASWSHNIFTGLLPASISGLTDAARLALQKDNWLIAVPATTSAPSRRGGRGR